MTAVLVLKNLTDPATVELARAIGALAQEQGYEVQFLDLSRGASEQEYEYYLQQTAPELLITFDCAGFDFRLMGEDLFYNSLSCPMAHILLQGPEGFDTELRCRMNFDAVYYTMTPEEATRIRERYEAVPAVQPIAEIRLPMPGEVKKSGPI